MKETTKNKWFSTKSQQTRVTPKEFGNWLRYSLDLEAENLFGEFGFSTLSIDEQNICFGELYEKGLIE